MERQSEQELLAIAPVETESLEGNRIYQVTGRELTQIAEISAREAVKMCREERKKTEKREQSNADKVKRTKKLLSDYRRLKREIPEKEEFTESEKVEKRWAFLRDLMGSAHINSQESVVEKEEKRRAENMYYINRIERAIETYREECETSKKPEAIEHIRQSLENIKKEMYGMTYRPLDMWDHLDEVLDDPHTLVIANPPTYFSGYEKFYDTQGKMTWKEPEYKLFDPETGHIELFDRCMNANALVVCYQEKRTGEAVGEPIFARAGTRADLNSYITSNRGEEAAALAEGRKIKRPSESKLAPIACSMLPRDYEITEKSKVQIISIKAAEAQ